MAFHWKLPTALVKRSTTLIVTLVLLLLVIVAVGVLTWWVPRQFTQSDVHTVITTTLQQEAQQSFLVTGELRATATLDTEDTKRMLAFLPSSFSTSRVTVRVPARLLYGFDVRDLGPRHVRLAEDGVIEVRVPNLKLYAVETLLEDVEIESDRGLLRSTDSVQEQIERGLEAVRPALRKQGEAHLAQNRQPRENTTEALEAMLTPAFIAAGMASPQFRFVTDGGPLFLPER